MAFTHICLFAAMIIVMLFPSNLHAQKKAVFSNYEYCVTDDGTFGLYKPKKWKVGTQKYSNGRMVFVTDPENVSYASGLFLEEIDSN